MGPGDLSVAGALGNSLRDLLDLWAGDEERNVQHVVTEGLVELVTGFTCSGRQDHTE